MAEQEKHHVYTDYFFNESAYDYHDGGYVPLEKHDAPESKLNIPEILKPDKVDGNDVWYTVEAQTGETQILPGEKTKTWGYNQSLLGKTIIYEDGKNYHVTLKNSLPELTTYHWHGLDVPGPYIDGGCHAPVYPGEAKEIEFPVHQPAATTWLHAHPCPLTGWDVWHGLACAVVVKDQHEATLPLPRNYGVDDIPVILQDRRFDEHNQWNYDDDYDPDGTEGPTALINGTVNPYFDVTTQKLRLRFLDGSNRREWRLHLSDDMVMTQIASDGGLLPEPVYLTKLMMTCAERTEVVLDFGKYKPGDEVTLYSDDTPILKFKIHEFAKADTEIPDHLADMDYPDPDKDSLVHQVVMSGTDEEVEFNGKKFGMMRIDDRQELGKSEYWDITNTNDCCGGMIHPYHSHGGQFMVVSRNGEAPYPNERGYKDTIGVNAGETVRVKMKFNHPGIFMYHCHIIEHEDGGMMAQLQVYTKDDPYKKYKLMDMKTLMDALAEERHCRPEDLKIKSLESYKKMGMDMC
ncbi:multicopper oxidase domain-containing protein [Fructilactobacillus hinvesii]|uniref:Multicopper oxidase domain-containing protein n=1 Tax=Fructilactobacillus hinvesii TaxID=2940300 RepID=A0ABY5BX74_9LACO|nr:multicopper oxidase domain-containing protein [Fructilactobacillus hinvesii]USS88258.1 multicopper oxidase domain-containing protein [Fructilactobacillus hinvesii]